jgi:hypothetical protein
MVENNLLKFSYSKINLFTLYHWSVEESVLYQDEHDVIGSSYSFHSCLFSPMEYH